MDELSDISCDLYRGYVRENKDFVPYFRSATPEQELGKLPLGSRPAKRRPTGGVESLRAIPWIFASDAKPLNAASLGWVPVRRCKKWWKTVSRANWKPCAATGHSSLPVWECWRWSSRRPTCGWRNTTISASVKPELWALGKELRELLEGDIKVVLDIANDSHLMEDLPWIAESIQLRNIYTDPLNVLQAELLHRSRLAEEEGKEPDPRVEQALMVTIAGVAAGMRNTG